MSLSQVTASLPLVGDTGNRQLNRAAAGKGIRSAEMVIEGVALTILNVAVPMTVSPTLTVAVAVPTLVLLSYLTVKPSVISLPFLVTLTAGLQFSTSIGLVGDNRINRIEIFASRCANGHIDFCKCCAIILGHYRCFLSTEPTALIIPFASTVTAALIGTEIGDSRAGLTFRRLRMSAWLVQYSVPCFHSPPLYILYPHL